jgi:hypothetical protein
MASSGNPIITVSGKIENKSEQFQKNKLIVLFEAPSN